LIHRAGISIVTNRIAGATSLHRLKDTLSIVTALACAWVSIVTVTGAGTTFWNRNGQTGARHQIAFIQGAFVGIIAILVGRTTRRAKEIDALSGLRDTNIVRARLIIRTSQLIGPITTTRYIGQGAGLVDAETCSARARIGAIVVPLATDFQRCIGAKAGFLRAKIRTALVPIITVVIFDAATLLHGFVGTLICVTVAGVDQTKGGREAVPVIFAAIKSGLVPTNTRQGITIIRGAKLSIVTISVIDATTRLGHCMTLSLVANRLVTGIK
jgi:hypothetical protein